MTVLIVVFYKLRNSIQEASMATLSIDGIDEEIIAQLKIRAKKFNTDINELATQFIRHGLNTFQQSDKSSNIDSLFGMVPSSTDGVEFQKTMREDNL
jgi:hypothetical protein